MFESGSSAELVESAPPRVTLRNAFAHPFDSAMAAARTCYSPRLIGPEEITDKQRLNIGAATFFSGHHTVYQHAHFEFGLENVSRQLVWSFLHAHPFYNSEQQSQRYVRMDRVQAYIPPAALFFDAESRRIYELAVSRAWSYYRQLSSLLLPDARRILEDIWHVGPLSHPKRIQKIERSAEKRAIEIARYVLPVAAFTAMVHTLSGIVLHRLWRMCAASDTPSEARAVVGEMVAQVRNIDAQFFDRFAIEPLQELPEWRPAPGAGPADPLQNGEAFAREFDARLAGRTAKLLDYSANAPAVVASSYRAVVGLSSAECPDHEALDRLLNPRQGSLRPRHERSLAGQEPAPGPRRPPGNRALPPAQRQIHPTRRIRLPLAPSPQMDHAHLLQCPGRNLPVLARRNRSNARGSPAAGKIHRAALPSPLRSRHSHLHRGLALLRRQSLAGLPERRPPDLKAAARPLAMERRALDFAIANRAGGLTGVIRPTAGLRRR